MAEQQPKNGISRRRMLKRIGAGAAVAWSAPIISSLRTPAFAQYGQGCRPEDAVNCAAGTFVQCGTDQGGGSICSCVRSVSGTAICGHDNCSGTACSTDADCQAYAPGSICQAPNTGCCGQQCIAPCGAFGRVASRGTGSNSPRS